MLTMTAKEEAESDFTIGAATTGYLRDLLSSTFISTGLRRAINRELSKRGERR